MNNLQEKYANIKFSGMNTEHKTNFKKSNAYQKMLDTHGICYKIIRNNVVISEYKGIENVETDTQKRYIGFEPNVDIKQLDTLINPVNEKIYVIDVHTQFHKKEAYQLKVYYQTEHEYINSKILSGNTVFNINNPNNSIIGNNNFTTINCESLISELKTKASDSVEDKTELQQIITLLEKIINEDCPPQKGMFSKFSSIMEKHSWLTSSIPQLLINWLINPPL